MEKKLYGRHLVCSWWEGFSIIMVGDYFCTVHADAFLLCKNKSFHKKIYIPWCEGHFSNIMHLRKIIIFTDVLFLFNPTDIWKASYSFLRGLLVCVCVYKCAWRSGGQKGMLGPLELDTGVCEVGTGIWTHDSCKCSHLSSPAVLFFNIRGLWLWWLSCYTVLNGII